MKKYRLLWECGSKYDGTNVDEAIFCQNLSIAFLKQVFGEPPTDSHLEIVWAEYMNIKAPVTALAFDELTPEIDAYEEPLSKALRAFDETVDWQEVLTIAKVNGALSVSDKK